MGALTETEIFDCMRTNLRLAIANCIELAEKPIKGPSYIKLRENLKLIEGACRQASAWREDTRWLNVAFQMGEVHARAGGWLRGIVVDGVKVKLADKHSHQCFMLLARNLSGILAVVDDLKSKATGKVGMILPKPIQPEVKTQDRQVGWTPPPQRRSPISKGGILLPGASA